MEEWRDVPGYEGLYQVSDTGSVRSYDKVVDYKFGRVYLKKGRTLKSGIASHGYKTVMLCDGKQISVCVHKIMALAFIPNPENYRCVNHIDGNKLNNQLSNLEWCSHSQNNKHAYTTGLKKAWIPTEQHKINHSNKLKGRKLTEEHKHKISAGLNAFYHG